MGLLFRAPDPPRELLRGRFRGGSGSTCSPLVPSKEGHLTVTEIVRIPFHGDEILTVDVDGKPHILLKPVLDGLGLDYWAQIEKLRRRSWAELSLISAQLPDDRQRRQVLSCDTRTLVMLLGTVDENRVAPRIRPKLIAYQAEVADAIEQYWGKASAAPDRPDSPGSDHGLRPPAEAFVYILSSAQGTVKVGFTSHPERRLRTHAAAAATFDGEIVATWLSPPHIDAERSERALIRYCEARATAALGNEVFRGVPYGEVVRFAECLPFKRASSYMPTVEDLARHRANTHSAKRFGAQLRSLAPSAEFIERVELGDLVVLDRAAWEQYEWAASQLAELTELLPRVMKRLALLPQPAQAAAISDVVGRLLQQELGEPWIDSTTNA